MNFNYQNCLEQAQDFRLDIDLVKSLFYQINSIDDTQNLILFLRKEQGVSPISVIRYLMCFFDLDLPNASLLYQEYNPNTEATQTQFQLKEPILTNHTQSLLQVLEQHFDLINMIFQATKPMNVKIIAEILAQSEQTVRRKLKTLIETEFVIKQQDKNTAVYIFNTERTESLKKISAILA